MNEVEDAARAALRVRQGGGARYDAPSAPAGDLALARRGTAYFARLLNDLSDADLWFPSARTGWTRRHLIAHVGYHARALARVVEGARTGEPQPLYLSDAARAAEIALGATLPARALRHLVQHAAIHLNVEWRDLTDADWRKILPDGAGGTIAVARTPWLRAHEVWSAALDLGSGGRLRDVPSDLRSDMAAR
ncbi:MAG: maleylpyruvate isomerase N-terminal domain-containing protein [Rhodobacteraceae bacterium]|nr:maleylpyruvate isomerase N-terminal domain-containing protein [Paracoccaceae bacterium]